MNHLMEKIRAQVQHNCHIADARHAADYTMCTYLLKMREFFRWEQGLELGKPIPKHPLGQWLADREALWETLEQESYVPLNILGKTFEPFATQAINQALKPLGLVYSAGLELGGKVHFYLAERLHSEFLEDGFELHVSGEEYARCLSAPPAMASEQGVFLRQEALRHYLWEKYEAWLWKRPDNGLGRAFACYDFEQDANTALAKMAEAEIHVAREHELGEYEAGRLLGAQWNQLVLDMALTPAELMARAIKDHLADALRTLPMLLEQKNTACMHFYMGNLNGMRGHLFPELRQAYSVWHQDGDWRHLEKVIQHSQNKWWELAEQLLALHERLEVGAADTMRKLVLEYCGLEA